MSRLSPIVSPGVTVPCTINTLPRRRKMADTLLGKRVLQGESAFTSAGEALPFLRTGGFSSCVVLALCSRSQKVGALAHFDIGNDTTASLTDLILPEFTRRGGRNLSARIIGGLAGLSERLVRELRDALRQNGVRIAGMELFNNTRSDGYGYTGLILDARSGELFDPAGPMLPLNAEESIRAEEGVRSLTSPDYPRSIRLVI